MRFSTITAVLLVNAAVIAALPFATPSNGLDARSVDELEARAFDESVHLEARAGKDKHTKKKTDSKDNRTPAETLYLTHLICLEQCERHRANQEEYQRCKDACNKAGMLTHKKKDPNEGKGKDVWNLPENQVGYKGKR
ncbi:hypothetical protein C8J56DRAFT_1020166 [Mycena floridula]|nr:hypothetical protein C8J56DRAFT_1020166 [Mycena floridula]